MNFDEYIRVAVYKNKNKNWIDSEFGMGMLSENSLI